MRYVARCRSASYTLALLLSVAVASSSSYAALAQGAATAGDEWLTHKGDQQRTGAREVRLGAPLNLSWRHTADVLPRDFVGSPLVAGSAEKRRVYFATGRAIFCVEAETGEQVWRHDILTSAVTSPILLLHGDQAAGASAANTGDIIVSLTARGRLSAVRAGDGTSLWEVDAQSPAQAAAPVLIKTAKGERIVITTADSRLIAFTRAGDLDPAWQVTLSRTGSEPTSTPALSTKGQTLFVTLRDKNVYYVDVESAKVERTVKMKTSSYITPLVLGDGIAVCTDDTIAAYATLDGRQEWRMNTRSEILAAPSGRVNQDGAGAVYVGTANGNFFAYDAKDGHLLWQTELGASLTGSPCVLSDLILVGSSSGVVFGLKPEDGRLLWRYRLHTERAVPVAEGADAAIAADGSSITKAYGVTTSPAVAGREVYVLANNAALYAFTTEPLDIDAPRVREPSLTIPDMAGKLAIASFLPSIPLVVPGRAPMYFATQLVDEGSGVDADSIKVILNKQELHPDSVYFAADKGTLTVTLADQPRGADAQNSLDDGLFSLVLTARDYRNNTLSYATSFTIDNSLPSPPAAPVVPPPTTRPAETPPATGETPAPAPAPTTDLILPPINPGVIPADETGNW